MNAVCCRDRSTILKATSVCECACECAFTINPDIASAHFVGAALIRITYTGAILPRLHCTSIHLNVVTKLLLKLLTLTVN